MSTKETTYHTTRRTTVIRFPSKTINPPEQKPTFDYFGDDNTLLGKSPDRFVFVDGAMPLSLARKMKALFAVIAKN